MTDIELGNRTLSIFSSAMFSAHLKSYSPDQIAAAMGFATPAKKDILADGIGLQVRITLNGDEDKIRSAMNNLASKSGGKLPGKATFDEAIRNTAGTYTFKEAAVAVVSGTVKELGNQAAQIGDNVLIGLKLLPFVAIAIGGLYVWKKIK